MLCHFYTDREYRNRVAVVTRKSYEFEELCERGEHHMLHAAGGFGINGDRLTLLTSLAERR